MKKTLAIREEVMSNTATENQFDRVVKEKKSMKKEAIKKAGINVAVIDNNGKKIRIKPNRKSPCRVSFWVSLEEMERLNYMCERLGTTRSEFFRTFINNNYDEMKRKLKRGGVVKKASKKV